MVAAAIGAAATLASAVIGAVGSARAANKRNSLIQAQRDDNRRWYNTKMNEDFLSRTDTQAALKKQRELLDQQYKRSRAVNVVAGGSDEALAMQQKAANDSLASTMTDIAGRADIMKDAAEQQYRTQEAQLTGQQAAAETQRSQAIAAAAGQGVSAGLNMVGQDIRSLDTAKTPVTEEEKKEVTDPNQPAQ